MKKADTITRIHNPLPGEYLLTKADGRTVSTSEATFHFTRQQLLAAGHVVDLEGYVHYEANP